MKKTHIVTLEIETELNQEDTTTILRDHLPRAFKHLVAYVNVQRLADNKDAVLDVKQTTILTVDKTKYGTIYLTNPLCSDKIRVGG